MKKILLPLILFFMTLTCKGALYIIVVGQTPPDLTHLCPGDTIRFSGDSLNGMVIGTIAGMVVNTDSTLNVFFAVSSDTNVATHWDHILLPGDIGYTFDMFPQEWGYFIFNCSTGLFMDSDFSSTISLYPNPATAYVTISSDVQIQDIILYDYFGNKIHDQIKSEKKFLDVSSLANGIYLVKINTNSGSVFKKLIKN